LSFNSQILADQHDKKEIEGEEELPVFDPFLGGASGSISSGNTVGSGDQQSNSLLNNLKLVGIIKGEDKKFAIFSSPDGRSVRYAEDTIVNTNLMILDIYDDHIYFKSNEQEYTIDLKNIITKAEN
jgi:hypothetical protein